MAGNKARVSCHNTENHAPQRLADPAVGCFAKEICQKHDRAGNREADKVGVKVLVFLPEELLRFGIAGVGRRICGMIALAILLYELVCILDAAVGSRKRSDELLRCVDKRSQGCAGRQAHILSRRYHGIGSDNAAGDDRHADKSSLAADNRNGNRAANHCQKQCNGCGGNGAPLLFQLCQTNAAAHIDQKELKADAGHIGKISGCADIRGNRMGHKQDQEGSHDDKHRRYLRLRYHADKIAEREYQKDDKQGPKRC